jgi:hypothetical protein
MLFNRRLDLDLADLAGSETILADLPVLGCQENEEAAKRQAAYEQPPRRRPIADEKEPSRKIRPRNAVVERRPSRH